MRGSLDGTLANHIPKNRECHPRARGWSLHIRSAVGEPRNLSSNDSATFESSKVSKDKKAPLIVALHGLGGDGNSLLRGASLDLAEAGGYILVGPMGYNPSGWFGSPVIVMGGRRGRGGPPGWRRQRLPRPCLAVRRRSGSQSSASSTSVPSSR